MELLMKPILTYHLCQREEATSWRPWGGLQSEDDLREETQRIEEELRDLASKADFPLNILPLSRAEKIADLSEMKEIASSDVILIYAAGGGEDLLRSLISRKLSVIFVRHRSSPVYLWYEIVHPILIRRRTDFISQPWIDFNDVVVDDYAKVLSRLKAIYGLKNTLGMRIISIGESGGWGIGKKAVSLAQLRWNLDIKTVPYDELSQRVKKVRDDEDYVTQARRRAEEYLKRKRVSLKTDRKFVVNAFVLYQVFKDLLKEFEARAITVSECMSTIMPIAETTACLPLSLLNDEGYLAFCESDFVVIPSGILLHHISGKPVFLNDPTYPHDGVVTLAHCTAPRKMDGKNYEKADVVTHFESDYGAAPKVNFRKGQEVTVIIPDFNGEIWVGFKGEILDSPYFPICRSQVDVEIEGDWRALLREMRGFHWMMAYGDYLNEIGYALSKIGIKWKVI
jgi:L-fucose isomerase-like protein